MSKLLYVESSPRKDRSASIEVAKAYVDAFEKADSANTVDTLDVWESQLPEFDGFHIAAKYRVMHGEEHTAEEAKAWNDVVDVVNRFKSADSYLFSLPMWNFSIPYKLKHFIDIIAQPSLTFGYDENGPHGLVVGKPATIVCSRGGAYDSTEASAGDFQVSYLKTVLGFIGFETINTVLIEPMLADPDTKANVLTAAKEQATSIASGT